MDSPQQQRRREQQRQHKHWQEVPSIGTSVCAAPLHHAIVKPVGVRVEHIQPIRKPLGQKWPEQSHFHSQTWRGNGGDNTERGRGWWATSIFRPSTSVPWSFSLALSASALDSNVTKPKPCEQRRGTMGGERGAWEIENGRYAFVNLIFGNKFRRFSVVSNLPWTPFHWKWSRHRGFCQIAEKEKK